MKMTKEEQKKHLIDMMKDDEELGLYEEPIQETLEGPIGTNGPDDSNLNEVEINEPKKRIANDSKHSGIKLDYQDGIFYGIEEGAKWQQERMYSEEEVREAFRQGQDNMDYSEMYGWSSKLTEQEWFENLKKKTQ